MISKQLAGVDVIERINFFPFFHSDGRIRKAGSINCVTYVAPASAVSHIRVGKSLTTATSGVLGFFNLRVDLKEYKLLKT